MMLASDYTKPVASSIRRLQRNKALHVLRSCPSYRKLSPISREGLLDCKHGRRLPTSMALTAPLEAACTVHHSRLLPDELPRLTRTDFSVKTTRQLLSAWLATDKQPDVIDVLSQQLAEQHIPLSMPFTPPVSKCQPGSTGRKTADAAGGGGLLHGGAEDGGEGGGPSRGWGGAAGEDGDAEEDEDEDDDDEDEDQEDDDQQDDDDVDSSSDASSSRGCHLEARGCTEVLSGRSQGFIAARCLLTAI
ncbi:hypothetical protein WJX79_005214 [Trebouxia sp. C0005]